SVLDRPSWTDRSSTRPSGTYPGPRPQGRGPFSRSGRLFGQGAQLVDRRLPVVGPVDGAARDEHVGPRLGAPLDGVGRDPAVDLEPHLAAVAFDERPGPPDLRQHHVEELLPAEP